MLKNHFKIAIRSLLKQKTFSFLNIFGLALGMSVCLIIIMLIKDAHSYDLFHAKKEQIYRINTNPIRKAGGTEPYASSPFLVGKTLAEEQAQVELWTPLINALSGSIVIQKKEIDFRGLYTDDSFFNMFNFKLAEGDPSSALTDPYSIVLTQKLAAKLFRDQSPIGQEIEISNYANRFKVTGVLEEFPGKTHLEFEALSSISTQIAEEKIPGKRQITNNWKDYYASYNFVRLNNSQNKRATENTLAHIAETKYKDLEFEIRDVGYHFSLQALGDITPGPILSNSMGRGMPNFMIWFLMVLGLIVILSACFNYTNLTIARSFIRTKEIGVRKVIGASRMQIFKQFMVESIITAFFAFTLGYLLMQGLKPLFLKLQFAEFTDLSLEEDWQLFCLFLVFTMAVGIIAGLLPGISLSSISPQAILKNLQSFKLIQRFGLRKMLLTVQLVVTLLFLITVTIAWQQINFATKVSFGYDQPKTLILDLQGEDYTQVSSAFSQINGVEKISGISIPMGTWRDRKSNVRKNKEDEKIAIRDYYIDENYLTNFNLTLVAGENFSRNLTQQKELFAIVNESFLKQFEFNPNESPIGQTIIIGDGTQLSIRGVVADFLFKPANYSIEPLLLRYDPSQLRILNLDLASTDISSTLAILKSSWSQFSDHPLESQFFEESIADIYSNMTDIAWIVSFFGIMSVIISCMGFLGMAIYLVKSKAKEISIRKTLGASVNDLVLLLTKNYIFLFVIATIIAAPLSYFVGSILLQEFANRISLSTALFIPGILLLFTILMITIGSQTVKAAFMNPANSLRSE